LPNLNHSLTVTASLLIVLKALPKYTPETALSYSWTGPLLRATGVDYDVRAMKPYSSYQDLDFEVPVGTSGDVYDRFLVRNEEMWQSMRMIEQC
jgi:NADH-quinone oxidoreductase subunit D